MKKLPEIFKNNIKKNINNNKKICYINITNEEYKEISNIKKQDITSINNILNQIFNGFGYAYNVKVYIKTKDNEYNTSLVIRNKLNVVTIDNILIPINDIIEIKIINKY